MTTRWAGLDLGSRTVKLVVVDGAGRPVHRASTDTGCDPLQSGRALLAETRPDGIVATGYGRALFEVAHDAPTVTEIKAHARGAREWFPDARAVLDIGGQDSKAIALTADGRVGKFEMNDRCAAGTGKFLEYTATAFGLTVDAFAALALAGNDPPPISSMCTVFAETEATTLMARGVAQADIALGLHKAIVSRTVAMLSRVGLRAPLVFVGGVAKNPCAVRLVAEAVGFAPLVPAQPDMTGALGAALWLAQTPA